ncbi:MAG TPA: ABC transporter permease [Candidatus Acidoferrales bacterium]|nr:ABC transporter permease [Candidatus Acidoferrales bacterium]
MKLTWLSRWNILFRPSTNHDPNRYETKSRGLGGKHARLHLLETAAQDLRFGARILRKNTGFAAIVVLALGLGIGANTAIFSATYTILLKALPYPDSGRLVALEASRTAPIPFHTNYLSTAELDAVVAQTSDFAQTAEYDQAAFTLTGHGEPESLTGMQVSGAFFSTYGVPPILGRPILPADAQSGHEQVAVLSDELWRDHFGSDPKILGKEITLSVQPVTLLFNHALGNKEYTVIGVMPPRPHFLSDADLWIPLVYTSDGKYIDMMGHSLRGKHSISAVARLKESATLQQVNTQLHTVASRLAAEYPATDKDWDLNAELLRNEIGGDYTTGLLLLLGAVSFVLLLACVAVSSLLIARSWSRQPEIAIRETLGATRWRLVRQLLSESILLALIAGFFGALLGFWGMNLLRVLAPPGTPRLDEVSLNGPVLAYTLAISLIAGILFGLAPALQLTRPELGVALKEGGTGVFASVFSHRLRRLRTLLVVWEISIAFVLLVGSGLAIRSFNNLIHEKLGYRLNHILTMYVRFSSSTCAKLDPCKTTIHEALERVQALPSVQSAAITGVRPFSIALAVPIVNVEGKPNSIPSANSQTEYEPITPGYFRTLDVPLLAGREFTDADDQNSTSVAIVNEAMARRDFAGRPIGKHFGLPIGLGPTSLEIIGEVASTRDINPSRSPLPAFYIPIAQARFIPKTSLIVRTATNPAAIASAVREQVWAVDKNAPISNLETMEQVMSDKVAQPRFSAILLTLFGGVGLLLALIGVYGVISYSVSQRTHELGVRMALGAQPRDILRMVLGEGMLLTIIGIGTGIVGALALTRFLRSLLFEITPTDPLTFVGVAVLVAAVAFAACYVPSRRAVRVDPVVALRHE